MLQRIVELSLRYRGIVIILACLMTAYGIYAAATAQLDVFPEFAPPLVVVQTEAPGMAPEEVEQLVTRPLESAINGVSRLDTIRSQSIQGLSVITLTFEDGADIHTVRQMVGERLIEAANELPDGISPPTLAPLTSATSTLLTIGLTSETRTPMELRDYADWTLKPALLGVTGVAKVAVFGGEVRQLQVQIRPDALRAGELTIEDLRSAAQRASGVRGAGFVETAAQRITLRTEGQALTPEQLGQAIVKRDADTTIRLADVARVTYGAEPRIGDANIQGMPGVILMLSSQLDANTLETTENVEAYLREIGPILEQAQITLHPQLFRPANFIESALDHLTSSISVGCVLVALVIFFFLHNPRTSFISLTAIPLSILTAIAVIQAFGATINTITLGGLAIAIGEVVDDAIIDVENILRRLRENSTRGKPMPAFRVVLAASMEVRSAVVYATFVVVLVFVPVLTMSGVQGRLFAPLGVAYILAMLASLGVALTVTPALSLVLLPHRLGRENEPVYIRWMKSLYGHLLRGVFRRPGIVMTMTAVLCVGAAATLPFFGGEFLPELREGHFILHMAALPGTSLEESSRVGRKVAKALLELPQIRSVAQMAGRAEKADDTWGTHYSEFNVDLTPMADTDWETVEGDIRAVLLRFPGVNFALKPFLTERLEETVSGVTSEVVVKVFGDRLDTIDAKARDVAACLSRVRGATDVQVQAPPGVPELVIRIDRDRLVQYGFQATDVLAGVETCYQGSTAAQVYDDNQVVDVVVILAPPLRRDPEQIRSLILSNAQGTAVPLTELADVFPSTGRYAVLHDGARRQQGVLCNVEGRDVASFVAEAARAVANEVDFPPGAYPVFAGAGRAQVEARNELLLHSALAGAGILLLLSVVFREPRNLFLVLSNLPFALVGGVLAVFATGGWLSIGALVGFVTLFGITTRNSIMMVSHFEHLVSAEGMSWGLEAALRGASERLVPILMTAVATGLGLLPIAINSDKPGHEIEGPMAIVILGGLATSTALNLLVLPTLAMRFGRFTPVDQADSVQAGPVQHDMDKASQ